MPSAYKIGILLICITLLVYASSKVNIKDKYTQVALVGSPYLYNFNVPGVLSEAGGMVESKSSYWWLNSGGVMNISGNIGSTNQGEIGALTKWRLLYRVSNPTDTDQGFHPQNIFRLVSRNTWRDASVEVYFRIVKDNLSKSYNRNISNGLLLMSRYQDQNNLYYSGLRVDGTAVIKKKRDGEYITLAQKKIFESDYDSVHNPNLLPKGEWIGIKSVVENVGNSVRLKLYMDLDESDNWKLVLTAVDTEKSTESMPIFEKGFVGIRTDFMDVEFRDFQVVEL